MSVRRLGVLAVLLLVAASAGAAPDLSLGRSYGELKLYPDDEKKGLYYFEPGELVLARSLDGTPELRFFQMRYVGTAAYGNAGESGDLSTLTIRVRMVGPDRPRLSAARRGMARALGRTIELRPLPIARFETTLVYAPIGDAREKAGGTQRLGGGHFEADEEGGRSNRDAFWSERSYSVSLDSDSSQLFWQALQAGELVMSISYAIFTRGVVSDEAGWLREHRLSPEALAVQQNLDAAFGHGSPSSPEEREQVELDLGRATASWLGGILSDIVDGDAPSELESQTRFLRAGASAIRVNARRHPDLFQRLDFNEKAPPGYAVVKVYCYDFKDALRPDLFYKKVEIEAQSVGNQAIPVELKFLHGDPELFAQSVRFPVPVHLDRPYRYRVTTASRDGVIDTGEWQLQETWGPILDVTTRASSAEPLAEAP